MKDDFAIHNLFWKSLGEYEKFDPQLGKLAHLPFVFYPPLIEEIPVLTPGIYILTGGRQVGKSTTLKLIIKRLLKQKKLPPDQIYYLPCDTIKDFTELLFEIDQFRQSIKAGRPFVLFIDEITYVPEWNRAIKSLADQGFFNHGSVLITGSDTYLLKDAMMGFPGRRGRADRQDFHLYPLSFFEYVSLRDLRLNETFKKIRAEFKAGLAIADFKVDEKSFARLQELFNDYLLTGGYLSAINDYAKNKTISEAVYKTYIQWIVGDMLKRGKNERSLKEIIKSLYPRLSKQVTWHSFINSLSIEHHQTIIDYMDLLERMDVLIVLRALREDKLQAAPKKAKKICLNDPFIFHALHSWAANKKGFDLTLEALNSGGELKNALVEGTIASLFHRGFESYYIKAEGEVDLAVVWREQFLPIEVKNSLTLNRGELKQILKYNRGLIGYAGSQVGKFEQLRVIPIPLLAFIAY